MLYNYVKRVGDTFEFLKDSGIEHNNVVYGKQFLDGSSKEFLDDLNVFKTVLLPTPENALDTDGTYFFNLREDGVVEYRPNYTVGVRIPESITMRQARLALHEFGMLQTVDAAIASGTDEVLKIEWEYATSVDRTWPNLVNMATALGMSSEQLDNLFILAQTK